MSLVSQEVIRIIDRMIIERRWQDQKYGVVLQRIPEGARDGSEPAYNTQGPGGHPLGEWLIIIESELEEAKKALVHGGMKTATGRDSVRSEILQVMAVCCAALEQHGVEE